jgi:predicted RNase H-like HicB family nuclease
MERIIQLHIEKLPEGFFLATSDDVQGLVAQGKTITETIEIARDVAQKILEARNELAPKISFQKIGKEFDLPLVVEM